MKVFFQYAGDSIKLDDDSVKRVTTFLPDNETHVDLYEKGADKLRSWLGSTDYVSLREENNELHQKNEELTRQLNEVQRGRENYLRWWNESQNTAAAAEREAKEEYARELSVLRSKLEALASGE